MAEISALLANPACRLLTLAGPGGVGKTRLGIQTAAEVADEMADGVCFVPLQPVASSLLLTSALADTLGLPLTGQAAPEAQLFSYLQDKELLLVLDNFEHLLAQVDLLSALLQTAPKVKLLVTAREVLSLQEEWIYPVQGMRSPDPADAENVADYDAVQLFTARVLQVRPHFSLADERAAVVQICRLVAGNPLALELAASWARNLSCAAIAAEIQDNIGFLGSTLRNIPDRHRSMQAVFDQSWKLLSPQEQDVFRQLSVFRGSFRRPAAEAIAAASLPTLSTLVNKSLLRWETNGRYHLHELLRQFAEERLADAPGGAIAVRDRHCVYYADFLRRRLDDIHGGRQMDAMAEMEAELANLRAAWQWAAEHARAAEIRQAVHALSWFWQYQSRYREAADALRVAIQPLEAGAPAGAAGVALAEVLVQYGWMCIRLGWLEDANQALERAQALYHSLGVAPVSDAGSDPLTVLGMLAVIRGDYDDSIRLCEKACKMQEARGDRRNLSTTFYVLTGAYLAQGRYREAGAYARQCYRFGQELNDRWSMAYTLNDLGQVALSLGQYEEAKQHYRASYAIRQQYNDREGMAVALRNLGKVALREENIEEAARLYRESLTLYEEVGDRGGLASALEGLGNVTCAQEKYAEAAQHFRQALQIVVEMQFVPLMLSILASIAEWLLRTEQPEQGLAVLAVVHAHPSSPGEVKARAQQLLDSSACRATSGTAARATPRSTSDLESIAVDLKTTLATASISQSPRRPAPEQRAARPDGATPLAEQSLIEPLTPRERDVLRLMADGLTNQQIAKELIVALGTVKAYTSRIYGKLGVQNRVQAVEKARSLDLL